MRNARYNLKDTLGKPKYYIDTPGKQEGEQYFWFPTLGNSMTGHSTESIPSGSLVLGRLLSVQNVQDIPLHRPIVVIIDDGGQQFCMLKTAADIKREEDSFCLHSYNTAHADFWLPFNCVKFIFVVERVRLPGGNEFVPAVKTE